MKYLIRFSLPAEAGNKALKDPKFAEKLQSILKEIKAEAAYFTAVEGQRGGYIVTTIDDASKIAAIGEKFWFFGQANVDFYPVMTAEDLKRQVQISNMQLNVTEVKKASELESKGIEESRDTVGLFLCSQDYFHLSQMKLLFLF
jgi:hypothetical protein